ncbi:MAG: c-type cytochrome [Desulfosarcinaceae bacterium]
MIDTFYNILAAMGYNHPVHPTEVHMPIGLIVGAFIFTLVAMIFRHKKIALTPRYCVVLALVWVFPTILLGIMDWLHFYSGAWILPIKVKLITAPILVVLLALGTFLGYKFGPTSIKALPVYFLCVCAVVVLGYFGGQLTFGGRTIAGPDQYRAGQKIYEVSCTACHPGAGNVVEPDKPLLHSPLLASQATLTFWLRHPATPMPAFPETKMPQADVQELYDYISNVLVK